jgi:benzaldehyde dehydrogenase (NAD)
LALGNAVVLKPDPRTAVCGGVAIARIFEEAGLPDGLLHVLPGGPDAGQVLVADPAVRIISFTGSTAAGKRVAELAARHLKRVRLELGGNSALIVLDDVDLERAVGAGAWGSFLHQGQICMTTGRHLVHEAIYEDYVAGLADAAGHMPVGDPATGQVALGPVIDERQRDKIHHLVTTTVEAGARLAAGGTYEGLFYQPTVLADVAPAMPAYASEVFGPVAPAVPFSTADEAAKLAADSEYGLSLGILTRDVMRGLDLARGSRPASSTSTIRPSTTNPTSRSAAFSPQARAPASAGPPTSRPSPTPGGSPSAATSPSILSEITTPRQRGTRSGKALCRPRSGRRARRGDAASPDQAPLRAERPLR